RRRRTLQVNVVDQGGTGVVTSVPNAIRCPSDCIVTFDSWAAPSMLLSIEVGFDSIFRGWQGACTGNAPSCTVTFASSQTVTAVFGKAPPPPPVRLTVSVTGSGRIVSTPAGT